MKRIALSLVLIFVILIVSACKSGTDVTSQPNIDHAQPSSDDNVYSDVNENNNPESADKQDKNDDKENDDGEEDIEEKCFWGLEKGN